MKESEPAPGAERTLERLVRRQRGRLIAGLVSRFGNHDLELAEDVAQDAIETALRVWPYEGIPDNPEGWLFRVARNRAIDHLRKAARSDSFDPPLHDEGARDAEPDGVVVSGVRDPELRLIFLACHPELGEIDRIALTLRIVGGFSAKEIGSLFLSTESAMAQRLSRSKRRLRALGPARVAAPTAFELAARLNSVLKVVYLTFSVGYAPRSGERLIRRDVADEAVRLAVTLADPPATKGPGSSALAALLCLQASRLDAREDDHGHPVLLEDQDRSRWDRALIDRGLGYLHDAMTGESPSRYHLEAGIAACHVLAPSWEQTDWGAILESYRALEALTGSPIVRINRCVAQAFAGDPSGSLEHLDALPSGSLADMGPLHIARAEILRRLDRTEEATECYRRAIACGGSQPVLEHLERRLSSSFV